MANKVTLLRARATLPLRHCAAAGEYGELLVRPDGGLLEGEPPVSVTEADLVGLLEAVLR